MDGLVEVLTSLSQRLNLLNLQLVADSCAESELIEIRKAVESLRVRISQCKSCLLTELQLLESSSKNKKQVLFSNVKSEPSSITNPAHPTVEDVTEEEFLTIPKYIKGRLTLEKLNSGVEFINKALGDKYSLLKQNPAKLSVELRQRYYDMRETESDDVMGRWFITENDMKAYLSNGKFSGSFKLDASGRSILAMLRHVGRIKENRGAGIIRFIIC